MELEDIKKLELEPNKDYILYPADGKSWTSDEANELAEWIEYLDMGNNVLIGHNPLDVQVSSKDQSEEDKSSI